jgi:hypothetical protein
MSGSFQVPSQGKLLSHALKGLLGVSKYHFGRKINCPINSKTVINNFFHLRLPCKSLNFMVLGYPSKKSQNHRNPWV